MVTERRSDTTLKTLAPTPFQLFKGNWTNESELRIGAAM